LLSSIIEHIGRLEKNTVDSVTVEKTVTVEPGQPAYAVNQGTAKKVKLEFGIPEGIPGVNSVEVGETLTLEPGNDAYVRNVGDYDHLSLEFGIPQGAKGEPVMYDTVAAMRSDQLIKDGSIIGTLGFHTKGDGGAAYYTVSSSSMANGMDVIALDNGLFATFVFGGSLAPQQFGAIANDTADSRAIIQYCLNYLRNKSETLTVTPGVSSEINYLSGLVLDLHGVYYIGENITTYPCVTIQGNGSIIYCEESGINVQGIDGTNYGRGNQGNVILSDVRIVGKYGADSKGVYFTGNNIQGLTLRNVAIANFIYGVNISTNVYSIVLDACGINQCDTCYHVGTGTNFGERLVIDNCVLANSNHLIANEATTNTDMYITDTSLDYCLGVMITNVRSRMFFSKCHFESNINSDYMLENSTSAGEMVFTDCSIGFEAINTNKDYLISNAGKVLFSKCNFGSLYFNYFADAGYVRVDSCIRQSATKIPSRVIKSASFDIGKIITNDNLRWSFDSTTGTLTLTAAANGRCTIAFDVTTDNSWFDFLVNLVVTTSATYNVGWRTCYGEMVDGSLVISYNIASRNLTDDEKSGASNIETSLSRREVTKPGCKLLTVFNVANATAGDTFVLTLPTV
jgi:hypothetical protein